MIEKKDLFWCTECLVMSTRPRIEFDSTGKCNACVWSEEKKHLDWSAREREFLDLVEKHRGNSVYDILVPVSGGKDGSYVAYVLKEKYGLNPLCVTVHPPIRSDIGIRNLENFKKHSGFPLIEISLPGETARVLNRRGFVEQGRPLYGWTTAIFTAVGRVAEGFGITLIMYGEDGEIEYGGSNDSKHKGTFEPAFIKQAYLEGNFEKTYSGLSESDQYFWQFPENLGKRIELAHWSYYEPWDSYRNYLVAKEFCGLEEAATQNTGTYTNFAQNDDYLYDLHTHLMYLKFGFGRANQDAGIDIRRGAMTREQAIQLTQLYDNQLPEDYVDRYLEYYKMERPEFDEVIDKWANKELFQKIDGQWCPTFEIV
jgi:N-acetyl sugar amidotransferase